jgi:hypothetical protein
MSDHTPDLSAAKEKLEAIEKAAREAVKRMRAEGFGEKSHKRGECKACDSIYALAALLEPVADDIVTFTEGEIVTGRDAAKSE